DDQMEKGRLQEIAKATAPGIGMLEIAAQKPQGKFLKQFIGRIRVADGTEQVTVNGSGITLQQRALGGADGVVVALVCLVDERPERRDATEALVQAFLVHRVRS